MKVLDAGQRGRIKITPDGKGGVTVSGRRVDVERIAKAVAKRERRNKRVRRIVEAQIRAVGPEPLDGLNWQAVAAAFCQAKCR